MIERWVEWLPIIISGYSQTFNETALQYWGENKLSSFIKLSSSNHSIFLTFQHQDRKNQNNHLQNILIFRIRGSKNNNPKVCLINCHISDVVLLKSTDNPNFFINFTNKLGWNRIYNPLIIKFSVLSQNTVCFKPFKNNLM